MFPGGVLCALVFLLISPAAAQAGIEVRSSSVTYRFGQDAQFSLEVEAATEVQAVTLFFRPQGSEHTTVKSVALVPGPAVTVSHTHDLRDRSLPPFGRVDFWWRIEAASLEALDTEVSSFVYEDNRFEWQVLDQPPAHVHWHQGDVQFGQSALDIAAAALARVGRALNAPIPERLDIYIYGQAQALQSGLRLAGRDWVGGHADPELGVVLVSAAPGLEGRLELAREIPHELTHVLLNQITGPGYVSLPNWLNEGVASLYEEVPPPEYAVALGQAVNSGALLSFQALCVSFPLDSGEALLAYAQSESLVRYIRGQTGEAGLQALIAVYSGGAGCSSGVERALGMSLEELEQAWRREQTADYSPRSGAKWGGSPSQAQDQTAAGWQDLGGYAVVSAILVITLLAAALTAVGPFGRQTADRSSPGAGVVTADGRRQTEDTIPAYHPRIPSPHQGDQGDQGN